MLYILTAQLALRAPAGADQQRICDEEAIGHTTHLSKRPFWKCLIFGMPYADDVTPPLV
jgi:hypothetical protein